MAATLFTLLFALPLLLLGGLFCWLGAMGLWGYLFGGRRDDPYRWPEVPATVIDHHAEPRYRGNRLKVTRGVHTERVRLTVTVRLSDGNQAQLTPEALADLPVAQPPQMDFGRFMREVDALALAQARERLPVGSTVMVRADPARRSRQDHQGRWVSASDPRVSGSRPLALFTMLALLGMGAGLLLLGSALLGTAFSAVGRP